MNQAKCQSKRMIQHVKKQTTVISSFSHPLGGVTKHGHRRKVNASVTTCTSLREGGRLRMRLQGPIYALPSGNQTRQWEINL